MDEGEKRASTRCASEQEGCVSMARISVGRVVVGKRGNDFKRRVETIGDRRVPLGKIEPGQGKRAQWNADSKKEREKSALD